MLPIADQNPAITTLPHSKLAIMRKPERTPILPGKSVRQKTG